MGWQIFFFRNTCLFHFQHITFTQSHFYNYKILIYNILKKTKIIPE